MRLHRNARLAPAGRLLLCSRVIDEGWTVADATDAAGCSERTGYKWLARFRAEGAAGMGDRSSRPHRIAATPPERVAVIERLRRLRFTAKRIAESLRMALSTVSAVLKRIGLGRLAFLEPPEPPNRYCRRHPGELIHIDVKKLGRFNVPGHRVTGRGPGHHGNRMKRVGWEAVHVCVDDTTRLAYVEILDDETAPLSVGFLARAVAWFAVQGRHRPAGHDRQRRPLQESMPGRPGAETTRSAISAPGPTGPAPTAKQSGSSRPCSASGPTPPPTRAPGDRRRALLPWLRDYNTTRQHGSLDSRTPIEQLAKLNNLTGNHS